MPNQYTKFRAASGDPATRAFTWREYNATKQKRQRTRRKTSPPLIKRSSSSESDDTVASTPQTCPAVLPPTHPLLLYLPSGGFRMDPFRSYPVAPDHQEMAVLDHYLYILAPSGKLNNTVVRPRDQHIDPHINLLLPYMMQDSSLFDAMLAACQASISMTSGLSAYNDKFFIIHRGRAMAGLRQKLAGDLDQSALVIMTLLVTCDYLLGDMEAVAGHTKALQRMTDTYGQLPTNTKWDRFVRHGVEAYKYVGFAATGMTDPLKDHPLHHIVDPFKDLVYPEQPFSETACASWTHLPPGFLDLMFASQISTQLCAIITAFDDLAEQFNPTGTTNFKVLHPVSAALTRFTQHKQATYIERCIAAGLIAYSFQYPKIQIPNMFHDPPMQGMLRLFSVNYRSQSKMERDVMIWSAVMAYSFVSTRSAPLPKSKDTFAQFLRRQSSTKNWQNVEKVLRRFLWTPSLLERWKYFHTILMKQSEGEDDAGTCLLDFEDGPNLSDDGIVQNMSICPVTGQVASGISGDTGMCPFAQLVQPTQAAMA